VFFRREEAVLRAALVKSDLLECVLGLGEGLFYNSPMPAAVVILRSTKSPERRGKVLLIDAVNEVARERAQSFLRESHQTRILATYRAFEEVEGFAAVATVDQIAEKGYSLAIPSYVAGAQPADDGDRLNVTGAIADWRAAAHSADTATADALVLLGREAPA
jgi:type I restriction enzyme M protein